MPNLAKLGVQLYYRGFYKPVRLHADAGKSLPVEVHLQDVPWYASWLTVCQPLALQMIAAHHGLDASRSYCDFLMGFTYGASDRDDIGFTTVGTDPETGMVTAAPYLGLVKRYFYTDDFARYLQGLRAWLARGEPVRVPLDMGTLYGSDEPLPHNEVLVGYDRDGFHYYEPVCRPPASCTPGDRPPGEPGLYVSDAHLLAAVASASRLFSYPWRYPFVVFEPGPRRTDLGPVWKQNGGALVGGSRWGQTWGAAAIERRAARVEVS